MKSNYKKLGSYIRQIDVRNSDGALGEENLYGISVTKEFIITHANLVGVTFDGYKIVGSRQFAYIPDTSRRGDRIAISLNSFGEKIIVSSICTIFEITDENELLPEYLMLWFMRPEFDRYARFMSNGSAREVFDWECMCGVELPIPAISEQRKIVHDYQVIADRIEVLKSINEKCKDIVKTLYVESFSGKELSTVTMANLCSKIGSGATPRGGKDTYIDAGITLIRSTNVYDYDFSYPDLAHISDSQAEQLSNVVVNAYDVLFNITGVSIARCCIVPSNVLPARVNQHVMILRPKAGKYMSYYILCTMCDQNYKNLLLGIGQSGSTREAINKQEMENFKIPVPSEEEITEFGRKADSLFGFINKITQEIEFLQIMQNSILSQSLIA